MNKKFVTVFLILMLTFAVFLTGCGRSSRNIDTPTPQADREGGIANDTGNAARDIGNGIERGAEDIRDGVIDNNNNTARENLNDNVKDNANNNTNRAGDLNNENGGRGTGR